MLTLSFPALRAPVTSKSVSTTRNFLLNSKAIHSSSHSTFWLSCVRGFQNEYEHDRNNDSFSQLPKHTDSHLSSSKSPHLSNSLSFPLSSQGKTLLPAWFPLLSHHVSNLPKKISHFYLQNISRTQPLLHPYLNHCFPDSSHHHLSMDLAEITSDLPLCFLLPSLSPRVYSERISQMTVFKRLVILCRPQLESPRWFPNLSE